MKLYFLTKIAGDGRDGCHPIIKDTPNPYGHYHFLIDDPGAWYEDEYNLHIDGCDYPCSTREEAIKKGIKFYGEAPEDYSIEFIQTALKFRTTRTARDGARTETDWQLILHDSDPELLTIIKGSWRDAKAKTIRIKDSHEYAWQINKTFVRAKDGAAGIIRNVKEELESIPNGCTLDCFLNNLFSVKEYNN